MTTIPAIYLNMPIKDLKRSVEFFTTLEFKFNPQFSSEDSTCMIVGENIFAMLCEENKFKGFIPKPIAEPGSTEIILSLQCESKDQVNFLAETAFAQGGRKINEAEDQGFMYSWAFEDLDGHAWDLFWFNPEHAE
jgi:predicted lactoylglutathione lyase